MQRRLLQIVLATPIVFVGVVVAINWLQWHVLYSTPGRGSSVGQIHAAVLHKYFIGKTLSELEMQFGPPASDSPMAPEWDASFCVGPNAIDNWWLVVRLNSSGVVVDSAFESD
jgi:hypothetical protein